MKADLGRYVSLTSEQLHRIRTETRQESVKAERERIRAAVEEMYEDSPVDCSYDPDFLEVLKGHVPPNHRRYDPDVKQWWIHESFAKQAARDAKTFFENVIEV